MKQNKLATYITRYAFIYTIALFASCTSQEMVDKPDFQDKRIVINADIYTSSPDTRADGEQRFAAGDEITVRKTLTGEECTYQLGGDGNTWIPVSSNDRLLWEGDMTNSFQAWDSKGGFSFFTLPGDQSTTDGLASADWLTAQQTITGGVPDNQILNLVFHHRMAKVVLNFVGGDDTFTSATPGCIHQVRIHSAHGSWKDGGDNKLTAVTPFPKIDTSSEIKITSKEVSEGDTKVTALLFPTDALPNEVFVMLSLNFPGDAENASPRYAQITGIPQLQEGVEYHFTVEVSSGRVAVIAVSEGEWKDEGTLPSAGGTALDMPIGYIGTAEGLLEYANTHDMTNKVARLSDVKAATLHSTDEKDIALIEKLYNARRKIGWIEIPDKKYVALSQKNEKVPYLIFPNMENPSGISEWRYDYLTGLCYPNLTKFLRWTFNSTFIMFESVIFKNLVSLEQSFTGSDKVQYLSISSVGTFVKEEFKDCPALKEIYAPALQLVENNAFSGCPSLEKLTVATNNGQYRIIIGKFSDEYAAWVTAGCELVIGAERDGKTPIKAWRPKDADNDDYEVGTEYGENELQPYVFALNQGAIDKIIESGLATTEEQIRERCTGCPVFAGFPWKSISVQLPDGTEVKRFDKVINN